MSRRNQNEISSKISSLLVGTMFTLRNSPISRKLGTKERFGSLSNYAFLIAYLELVCTGLEKNQ